MQIGSQVKTKKMAKLYAQKTENSHLARVVDKIISIKNVSVKLDKFKAQADPLLIV